MKILMLEMQPIELDDESFKCRALSASAVMSFDGQTEQFSPVDIHTVREFEKA